MEKDFERTTMGKEVVERRMEKKVDERKIKKFIVRNITKDTTLKRIETKETTENDKILSRKFPEGVSPSSNMFVSTGRALVTLLILVCYHVSNYPVNADPLSVSGSQTPGASLPSTWSGRPGSLTDQIMIRHVYEQVRSLKFAYEENINQLMRKVDTIDMKLARHSCDYSGIETLVRKIESLDIKVNRLEASNVHRLEELSKTIHTKGIRQELAMDGLVQKVDENHERIKQKLIFAEKRLETINSKMQIYEGSFTRVESRLTDIDNEISDVSNTLDDIKSLSNYIDDKHNNTQRTMKEQIETIKSETASRQQLEELSSRMNDIGSRLNDTTTTTMVRDDENVHRLSADVDRSLMMDLRSQINYESRQIEDKITSMYNNLWSRFMSLETTAKHLLKIGNITRRQLREDFQSLLQSEARYIEPESQENYMNLLLDVLKRMLQEHKEQMDSNLQMSLTSQNLFIDSLNKSVHYSNRNEELKDMEITLSSILEKIIYTITNKTSRMDSRLVEVMQMIKEYKTQTMRSLTHLTKMVVSLTEKNKEDKERYEKGMMDMTRMNEIIASVLQDLYENVEMIGNMTPACEETTKKTDFNSTREKNPRELDETDNSNEEQDKEIIPENRINIDKEIVPENRITIENDVVKIYSENGTTIEHTNASYRVLNTTNSTKINETITKKQISIVIPFEAIEDGEELKSKLQDFLSQLPVHKTEAIIVTNVKQQTNDSEENNDRNLEENNSKQTNSKPIIHITLNDGISGNNINNTNITTSFFDEKGETSKKFDENSDVSDSDSSHIPVSINLKGDEIPEYNRNINDNERNNNGKVETSEKPKISLKDNEGTSKQNEEDKKFYDLDGNEDFVPSSREEIKDINEVKPIQDGEEKRIYDWDGNEDMIRSMEEKKENFENSMEGEREEGKIETSTNKNENLLNFPILNISTYEGNTSQFIGSIQDNNESNNTDDPKSIIQTIRQQQEESTGKQGQNITSTEKLGTEILTTIPISEASQILPTLTTNPILPKLPTIIIESTTNKNEKSKRRTKQDIKQLFEELKTKRQQRIQELAKETEMMQKDLEGEVKNEDPPLLMGEVETPLARRDTSEHFRPITSSEESANSEPAFDLLYDEQEVPYSA